jgi:hypothetical protein
MLDSVIAVGFIDVDGHELDLNCLFWQGVHKLITCVVVAITYVTAVAAGNMPFICWTRVNLLISFYRQRPC